MTTRLKKINIYDLVGRLRLVRAMLPSAEEWEFGNEYNRSSQLLAAIDEDGDYYNDTLIFVIYLKAHRTYFGLSNTAIVHLNIKHSQLLEIFDLAERFAKIWTFS
jgi:hypothetical protein